MIHVGDCLDILPTLEPGSVQCCVTSPPYFGLRDYGVDGQHGSEETPEAFVANLVEVFRRVRTVLRDDGTLWLNLGDSYASTGGQSPQSGALFKGRARQRENVCISSRISSGEAKVKDLIGIPWMVAFALRADGWYLRQEIIWAKPNPMPESVTDRCTKAHEHLFLLAKSPRYFFDADAIKEPVTPATLVDRVDTGRHRPDRGFTGAPSAGNGRLGDSDMRNKRSVWTVATTPFKGAHFATFPPALIQPCILAGSQAGDLVLDPYMGAGTTAVVCERLGRRWVGCELNPEYAAIAARRLHATQPGLALA